MTEMFRHNLMTWALALITATLVASMGWVFRISSGIVELRIELDSASKEIDRNRAVVDGIRADQSLMTNALTRVTQRDNTLAGFLERIEARQNLQSDRISTHEGLGLHHEAGLLINGIQIKLANLMNRLIDVEHEADKGERYTLQMATENNREIYTAIGKTENNLNKAINELIELQRSILTKEGSDKKGAFPKN